MKSLFYAAFFLSTLLLSCQENLEPAIHPDPPPDMPEQTRIKTETYSSNVITYIYDLLGRQIMYSSSGGFKKETTYTENQIQQTNFNEDGIPTRVLSHTLNDRGLIIQTERSDAPGAYYTFEYNDDDQVVKTKSVNSSGMYESISTYTNGNEETVVYTKDGELQYTYKYFYYMDRLNGLDSEIVGEKFSGKGNKNLMKSWIGIGKNGVTFTSYSYTYTFDGKGRIATMNQIHNDQIETYTYTYY